MPTRFAPKGQGASETPAPIDDALLAYLRSATGEPALSYGEAPTRISGGFDTTIYGFRLTLTSKFSMPLIVRIFRPEAGNEQAQFESDVQNAVDRLGFPTPPVLFTCTDASVLGSAFLIMPRVPGRVMLDAMLGLGMVKQFRNLGKLHARLHALSVDAFETLVASGEAPARWVQVWSTHEWMEEHIVTSALTGLAPGLAWIAEHYPPASRRRAICHGDFHPINILMSGREVTGVIDWSMARMDDPAWDVGATVALMSQGPVDLPPILFSLIGRVRGWLVGRYLSAYRPVLPLDMTSVRYFEAVRYLGFLIEAGEYIQAAAGILPPLNKSTAFGDAHVQQGIVRRFRQITGVTLALPTAPSDPSDGSSRRRLRAPWSRPQ